MLESCILLWYMKFIDGLAQDCGNSNANALELPQSCVKPSTYPYLQHILDHKLYSPLGHPIVLTMSGILVSMAAYRWYTRSTQCI